MRNILSRVLGILVLAGLVGMFVASFVLPCYVGAHYADQIGPVWAAFGIILGWLVCLAVAWGVFEWLEGLWWP